MSTEIAGASAAEIADSIRDLLDRGVLAEGDALPPVRRLADRLGVNRNTVVAAYRLLAQAGTLEARGRAGTRIAPRRIVAQDGAAQDTRLRDIGSGNPDPAFIPDPGTVLRHVAGRPVLYGEPVLDEELRAWASHWLEPALAGRTTSALTVTGGAVDAVERLLAQALVRDDLVALEDPCFLASIHTVRLGGYRAVPVPVDEEGMTVDGLRTALQAGARAVVCTPRAQNPTGASLTPARARALRRLLADYPFVLVIEDDHFSMLAGTPAETIVGAGHQRWALVRSVSKFLGPDMCLAITATDADTADRLALRLSPGTTWVSHLLQRIAVAQLRDPDSLALIDRAGAHYTERNAAFAVLLRDRGITAWRGDGLNLWVELPLAAAGVREQLMRRGWLARTGDEFQLVEDTPSRHLRLTVHELDDAEAVILAGDLAAAIEAAPKVG